MKQQPAALSIFDIRYDHIMKRCPGCVAFVIRQAKAIAEAKR